MLGIIESLICKIFTGMENLQHLQQWITYNKKELMSGGNGWT
jgi:hypothetical protein